MATKKNVFANGPLSVYVGKYKRDYGYGEFYRGKTTWHLGAKALAIRQSKVGDKVILKNGTRVVKTGKVVMTNQRSLKDGSRLKSVEWD